jgi:hypothetical protein
LGLDEQGERRGEVCGDLPEIAREFPVDGLWAIDTLLGERIPLLLPCNYKCSALRITLRQQKEKIDLSPHHTEANQYRELQTKL